MTDALFRIIKSLDSEVSVPTDGIVSRTIFQDEHIKAVLFGFAPGQELSEHTASMPAIMHFVRGQAKIVLGGESDTASDGTWVHMAPNLPHSVLATTEVVMLLLLLKCGKPTAAKPAGSNAN